MTGLSSRKNVARLHKILAKPAQALSPILRILARKQRAEHFDAVEFLLFCCVGALNTCIDFLVFLATSTIAPLYAARTLAWAVACAFSYMANSRFVFLAQGNNAGTATRFIIVNLFGLSLGILSLEFLHGYLGWGKILSYAVSVPFTMLANYFGYKLWGFKQRGMRR